MGTPTEASFVTNTTIEVRGEPTAEQLSECIEHYGATLHLIILTKLDRSSGTWAVKQ